MQNNRGKIIGMLISGLVMMVVMAILPAAARQAEPAPAPDATASPPPPDSPQQSAPQPGEPAIRFTPSEKIRADDAVPFPVDI
jgi:hypothetical protein